MLPLAGDPVELGQWIVGAEFVAEYLGVVEDRTIIYRELDIVPPMSLAARAVGALVEKLALPPGTIHAAQELESRRLVMVGEQVTCRASVSKPRQRGGWAFVSADFTLSDTDGQAVLEGKSTVLIPAQERQAE